ncbi:MAG: CopG family transcriptional regulator [Coxiellaceae bacterium]|nr:CopG family transcriptional regulator [Coxiellaceae bacterium]
MNKSTKKNKSKKTIAAKEFDEQFEDGDVTEYLDLKSAKLKYPIQRLSIDFTKHMIEAIDIEAAKIGVTRTALIKMWVAERLDI